MKRIVFILILLSGMMAVSFAQEYPRRVFEKGKMGYKLGGDWVIAPIFEYGSNYHNGYAMVRMDGKYGFIDREGNLMVDCLYDSVTPFDPQGIASGMIKEKRYYIDTSGIAYESLAALRNASEKSVEVETGDLQIITNHSVGDYTPTKAETGKWGYMRFGEWVIQPRFDAAGDFSDGLAPVYLGGKWGFIGKDGTSEIPFKYERVGLFVDGLARAKLYGKWGYIDKTGTAVTAFKYTTASDYSDGFASVSFGQKEGFIDKTGEWFDSKDDAMHSFSAFARHFVEADINQWQKKGKYEKMAQWQARVTDRNRQVRIDSLISVAKESFIQDASTRICQDYSLVDYDSESEVFLVHDAFFGNLLVPVPIQEAEQFEKEFRDVKRIDTYCVNGDNLGLKNARFDTPDGRSYMYNNTASLTFASVDIDYNFETVIFEEDPSNPVMEGNQTIGTKAVKAGPSDVDLKIPVTDSINRYTFALIITNENYKFVSQVPFANNDGMVFDEYCQKTLGIPKDHIHRTEDATYGMIVGEMDWITNIARVYKGQARILMYYAGHGIPDESTRDAFLLPVDGMGSNTLTAIKLSDIYSRLSEYPTASTIVFLDACFSGAQRNGEMLAQARGVAIKPKAARPSGNMVVFSAASGDETAYPYNEKGHGLFSYFLLKKLQESRGEATLGELADYLAEMVGQQSIVQNAKSQTPTVVPSEEVGETWMNMKLTIN